MLLDEVLNRMLFEKVAHVLLTVKVLRIDVQLAHKIIFRMSHKTNSLGSDGPVLTDSKGSQSSILGAFQRFQPSHR